MIFYFSGTGNSRYVAQRLSEATGESLHFIPRTDPVEVSFTGNHLGFVFPIYSWGVPPIVSEFISKLSDGFGRHVSASGAKVWMVCTCGDDVALAPEMLRAVLAERHMTLEGAWSVIMPNTYVVLPGFNVDSKRVEIEKLEAAPARVAQIAAEINAGRMATDVVRGKACYAKSRIVYPLFKRWGIFPSRWHWTNECVGCEKCASVCPVRNITMQGDRPRWGGNCVSCLACYHHCPTHAVAYGNATTFKGQYVCPL